MEATQCSTFPALGVDTKLCDFGPAPTVDILSFVQKDVDLAIIGGGASGLAVAIQVIERLKNGHRNIKSITVIEKRSVAGPGLAYSESSAGLIINMHSQTMGLNPLQPLQFTNWVNQNTPHLKDTPFPRRYDYGEYLKALVCDVVTDSKKLGIAFNILNLEVRDIVRHSNKSGFDVMTSGGRLKAHEVVLALGNFCASSHPELRFKPGYFNSPWPIKKLETIDQDANVLILGSRLTAVDVANVLVEQEHRGEITFVSRSAKLPKVQGSRAEFDQRYKLYNLAKRLEQMSEASQDALSVVVSTVQDLIQDHAPDYLLLRQSNQVLTVLQDDIREAKKGPIPWQTVIREISPLAERYWHKFSTESKLLWLEKYNSGWMTHKHSMPLENGQKIHDLLEISKLRIVQGSKIAWNESKQRFVVQTQEEDTSRASVEGDVFIESLGPEFDTEKLDCPLLKSLITSGLVKAHPLGGLDVDFKTLKAAPGLHVIGSMTRGVHFYVTAIDRITAHASRIADSLMEIPFLRPLHIALFIGHDIISPLMLRNLITKLLAFGHFPFIFLITEGICSRLGSLAITTTSSPKETPDLQHKYSHSSSLKTNIFPGSDLYFDAVRRMAEAKGILVKSIPNMNDLPSAQILTDNYIELGISIGGPVNISPCLVHHLNCGGRALLALRMTAFPTSSSSSVPLQAPNGDDKKLNYTLHHINGYYKSGTVIDHRSKSMDCAQDKSAMGEEMQEVGVSMLLDAVERFSRDA